MPKNQGFGPVLINGKNYEAIKVGDSLIKRRYRYDISDNIGYTVLKIKCLNGSNIFNQLNLNNIESIKIINESTNVNIKLLCQI